MCSQVDLKLTPNLKAFAENIIGALQEVRFCGWRHAQSRVWEVKAAGGTAFLKAHKQDRKFKQELGAYLAWMPALAPHTPELLGAHAPKPSALLLRGVPGGLVDGLELSLEEELEIYRQAGRFLRRLHDLPFKDDDPMPPAEALRVRAAAWCERAAAVIDEESIAWVRKELMVRGRFDGMRRAPCHRDFSPRNWLYDRKSGGFSVIDFEHARGDVWLADLLKLWDGPWQGRPELEASFFEGYGRPLSEWERLQLAAMGALHALATIVWSRNHEDAEYERHGWRLMASLRGVG